MKRLGVCSLIVWLSACVYVPQPYDVARSCSYPSTLAVTGEVYGDPNRYQQSLNEQCVRGTEGTRTATTFVRTPYHSENTHRVREEKNGMVRSTDVYDAQGAGWRQQDTTVTSPNMTYGFSWRVYTRP
jgi:hypothetical protein